MPPLPDVRSTSPAALAAAARVAEEAADRARREILPRFRDVAVETKSDGSPVTEADRRAELAVRETLRSHYPAHAVLGEEFGEEPGEKDAPDGAPRWVIDPIDGTIAFSRGIPLFSTLIALVVDEVPVVGLIDLPGIGERYVATRGGGCLRNGAPVHASQQAEMKGAFVAHGDRICFRIARQEAALARLEREALFTRTYTDAFGHSLAMTGAADAVLDTDLSPWDWMASRVLAEEAGGAFLVRPSRRAGKFDVALGSPPLVEELGEWLEAGGDGGGADGGES